MPLGSSISDESRIVNAGDNAQPSPQVCSCGNKLEPCYDACSQCGASTNQPAPAEDTNAQHGLSEASELADENAAPEAVKFPGYTSYVDSAVASLRATLLAEAEQFAQQQAAADAALHDEMTQLQNELLDEVQDYLLQTVTVTAENGDALRSRCQRLRDASLNALATARTKHSQAATTAHTTMAEVTCAKFDAELEGHQGRMSKRFLDARDLLGSRLADMRRAKDTELRDKYALDRVLLAEHKAIESHKAQEALALEKARLAAEWAPLAQELTALKKVVELRDYQVEQAQAEVQRLQTRLKVYEPPWADPTTGKFEVHPDMSWSFLDESMFVTLLEVGVARGNLSKQSLVGALGAASKIVLQESQRRQMAENSHDRGRERLPAIAAYYKDSIGNNGSSSGGKKGGGQRGGGIRGRSRGIDDDYDDDDNGNGGKHGGDKKKKGNKKGGGSGSSKGRSGSRDSGKSQSPATSSASRKKAKGGGGSGNGHSKSPSTGGSRKKHGFAARSRRMRSDRSLSEEDEFNSGGGGGDRHHLDSSGSDFGSGNHSAHFQPLRGGIGGNHSAHFQPLQGGIGGNNISAHFKPLRGGIGNNIGDSDASIGNLTMKAVFAPGFGEGRSGLRPNTNNSTGVTAIKEMNLLKGMVCALRRALDESEAKVATQNKALTEFKSETVPLLQGQLNVTNSQLKSLTADHATLKEKHKAALAAAAKNEQVLKGVVKRNLLLEASLNGGGGGGGEARSLSPEKKKGSSSGGGKKSGSKNAKRKKKGMPGGGGGLPVLSQSSSSSSAPSSANQSLDDVSNSGKNNDRDTAIIDPVEKSALVPTEFGFGEVKGSSSSGGAGQRQKGGAASGNENGDQGQQATRQKSTGGQKGGMAVNQDADAVARAEAEELVRQRWAAQQQQQQLEGLQTSSSSSSSSSSRAGAAPVNGASGAEKTSKAKATTGATRSNSPDVVDQGEEGGEDDNGSVYSVAPSLSPREPNAQENSSRKHKHNKTNNRSQKQSNSPNLSPVVKAQVTPRTPPSSHLPVAATGAGASVVGAAGAGGGEGQESGELLQSFDGHAGWWPPSPSGNDQQQQQQREAYFSAANQGYEADLASSNQSTARLSVEEGDGDDYSVREAAEARAAASAAAAQLAAFALAAQEKDTLLAQLTSALQQQKRKASSLQQQLLVSEERAAKLAAAKATQRAASGAAGSGDRGGGTGGKLPPHAPQWELAEDNKNNNNGGGAVRPEVAAVAGLAGADASDFLTREFMVSGSAPQRSNNNGNIGASAAGKAKTTTLPELPPSSGAFAQSSTSGGSGAPTTAASQAATTAAGAFTTSDTNNRAPTPSFSSSSSSSDPFTQRPPPRLLQSQPLPSQGSPAMTAAYAHAYGFEPNPPEESVFNPEAAAAWMDTEARTGAEERAKIDALNALALKQQAEARDVLRRSFLLQNQLQQSDKPEARGVPGGSSGGISRQKQMKKSGSGSARTMSPGRVGFAAAAATTTTANNSAKNPAVPVKQGITTLQERDDPFSGALAPKLRAGGGPSARVPGGAKRRETWQAAAGAAAPPSLPSDSSAAGGRRAGGQKAGGSRGSRLGK